MYIAMNRFRVKKDRTGDFETMWHERDSHLHEVGGFVEFHLLRGPERDDHVLYSSHTVWRSLGHFEGWTKSEAFRKAHTSAGHANGLHNTRPPRIRRLRGGAKSLKA